MLLSEGGLSDAAAVAAGRCWAVCVPPKVAIRTGEDDHALPPHDKIERTSCAAVAAAAAARCRPADGYAA